MAILIGGRGVVQLVAVVVATVVITSFTVITFDVSPALSQVLSRIDGLQRNQDESAPLLGGAQPLGPDDVVVSLEQIMKAPVSLEQDDPRLIQRIKNTYLHPPSTQPYSLASTKVDPSMGQSAEIRNIIGEDVVKEGGFFIECGALDGETRSNTLVFEKKFNWRGVLIEGDPKNFELVKKKNRRAWTVDACLSTQPYPNTVMFRQQFNVGKISALKPGTKTSGYAEVQCLPIYSILLALNTTTIDYFSLDVEGVELEVLRTIPWDRVNIKTLSVEFIHGKEGKSALKEYMKEQGYHVYNKVTHPGWLANDFIFVRNDFYKGNATTT